MRAGLGATGAVLLSLFVCCAALSTINASIFTGAQIYHALGEDLAVRSLSFWSGSGNDPAQRNLHPECDCTGADRLRRHHQGRFRGDGELHRAGVLWFFLFLVGVSSIILRQRQPNHERPFPHAALSDHAGPVLPDVSLSALFKHCLCEQHAGGRRRAAARHSAAAGRPREGQGLGKKKRPLRFRGGR